MTIADTSTDDQLIDQLDDALMEIRAGKPIDRITWKQTHPCVGDEGLLLLETLILLSSATKTWRETDLEDSGFVTNEAFVLDQLIPPLIGRYKIRGRIGSGGMGDVFEGFDPELDRRVAIKVPRLDRMMKSPAAFAERFLREARAAAAVRHENICPVYDAGKHNDAPYVVMEFVDGKSLEQILARGRIEIVRAVGIVRQVADALEAIHKHGIIHRDLKPGNILIDKTGKALLTDFGLAVSTLRVERMSSDGLLIGTPVYMSPEQAGGENLSLTPSADIYSLGAVLYEMLTGTVPFRAPLLELLRCIKSESPPSPTSLFPEIDPRLSHIVSRAMEKAPKDRFKSAAEMSESLHAWLAKNDVRSGNGASNGTTVATVSRRNSFPSYLVLAVTATALMAAGIWRYFGMPLQIEKPIDQKHSLALNSMIATLPVQQPISDLKGDIEIKVWSDPDKLTRFEKHGLLVSRSDSGALPLRNEELVHLHVMLNRPAYVYLIWIDSLGKPTPLYPWDFVHSTLNWDAPFVADGDQPTDVIDCPGSANRGLVAEGPAGMQHVVVLARSTPLPSPREQLQRALSNLPSSPIQNPREVAYLEWSPSGGKYVRELRGVAVGKEKEFDAPVFEQLKDRLKDDFELIKVWRFPQVDE